MVEKWQKLKSKTRGRFKIFNIREDTSRSPRTGEAHSFFIMDSADWINIIPITPEGKVVLIHQYRHGTAEITLEIPGGVVDSTDNSPADSARREMIEETGYDSDEIVHIGTVAPNPAILNNRCHTYLAKNARLTKEQAFDSSEDIAVELHDLEAIPRLIESGQMHHALVVAAFYHFEQFLKRNPGFL